MEIKFKASKKKVGNSYMIIVPIAIAKLLDEDKEYTFVVKEK